MPVSDVVQEALKGITENKSTGITHPNDKGRAIEAFKRLLEAKESYDADEVRKWLVENGGWSAENADAARNLAADVAAGKNVRSRTEGPFWKDDVVDRWREAAAKKKS